MEDIKVKYSNDGKTLVQVSSNAVGEFIIPDGVTKIEYQAFSGCTGLTNIIMPDSVTAIGEIAFIDCTGIKEPIYNKHLFAYMPQSFSGSYKIPSGITEIGCCAFLYCKGLTSVEIPDSVKTIGGSAFSHCTNLTSIKIPDSVTQICERAFWNCTGLTSFVIPDSVNKLGMGAFKGCKGLKSIEISRNIEVLYNDTFEGCSGLTSFELPDSVFFFDYLPFSSAGCCFECCESLRVPIYNEFIFVYMPRNYWGPYKIPSGIMEIAPHAFEGCESLEEICFGGDNIEMINSKAFHKCKIRELHIRNRNANEIEVCDNAFDECAENCDLYVPAGCGESYRRHKVFSKFKNIVELPKID